MKTTIRNKVALTVAIAAALAAPGFASAESTATSGAGALSTAARLDFSIVIPRFLRLQVGSPNGTVDMITFTVLGANVGNGTPVAGTGGDAAGTGSTVTVQANSGQVTITASNSSGGLGLSNGAGSTIPFTDIATVTTLPQLPAPTLTNAGGTTSQPTLNAGNITNRTGVWNFSYVNTQVYAAGTYGTSVNGGRVTYTAATP
jgi:hypothetical protein